MMVEIFDHWQDAGLTGGERNDLLVLAENANDGTRLTFGPVHEDYILRRAGKTPNGWKNAIGKLLAKKVLTVHTPGRIKQAAVYRLEPLCPEVRHDGYKGACVRSPERVTSQVTLSEKEGHSRGDPMGHPSGDPLDQEGHLPGVERVTPPVTPTPPNPSFKISSTTSSSVAEVVPNFSAVTDDNGGGGGVLDESRSMASEIVAALDYRGKVPDRRLRQAIEDRLTAALAGGWSVDGLALYLDLGDAAAQSPAAVYAHRLKPGILPDAEPIDAPQVPRSGIRGPVASAAEIEALTIEDVLGGGQPAGGMWGQAVERAQARLAGSGGRGGTDERIAGWGAVARRLSEHKPYSNDVWSEPAIEADAAKIPHCGDPDCDPRTRLRDGRTDDGLPYSTLCQDCHPRMRW